MRVKVFQGVARYSKAFQGVQGWFMVFQGGSWCSKVEHIGTPLEPLEMPWNAFERLGTTFGTPWNNLEMPWNALEQLGMSWNTLAMP